MAMSKLFKNVPIGHLIVVLSGDEAQRQQALAYLAKQGVRTNVFKPISKRRESRIYR